MGLAPWQSVQLVPLGMLSGADVAFADWPTLARNKVEDSMAEGVAAGCVDPAWTDADLKTTAKRVGEAWHLRATWSPAAAA